tara:strand:- start:249 stop:1232 length:984 start_codon:yes stop_codon:yes gene_type:complete
MRKVFLHGELGESLGKEWDLDVNSVQEALWAIEANTSKLTQFLMKNAKKFTHYTFAIDDKDLIEHQLKSPIADDNRTIHIMPQMAGGVEWVIYIVVAIVIGLVMQAIFKPPKPKDAIETNSYLFAGTENVTAQGVPVPLGYGRLRVGSVVLSSAVRHVEYNSKVEIQEVGPHGPYFVGRPIGRNKDGHLFSEVGRELFKSGVTNYELGTLDESQAVYSEEYDLWYYPDELFWHLVDTADSVFGDDVNIFEHEDYDRCWVAREVYGVNNPKWLLFRHWLLNYSPNWFCNWYEQNGKMVAKWLSKNNWLKPAIRRWMNGRIQSLEKNIK